MDSRYLVAGAGLGLSVLVSVLAWVVFDTLVLFLVLPFVPLVWWRLRPAEPPSRRRCPRCGYSTTTPDHEFCPRDGSRLESLDGADQG
ncbi:MAG: hypothetical protein ACOC42_01050 [Halobacteriota archaeon]